jgi:hypothetical protein
MDTMINDVLLEWLIVWTDAFDGRWVCGGFGILRIGRTLLG